MTAPDLTPFNAAAAEALAVYDYGGIGTWLGLDNSTRVGHIAYWTPVAEVAVAAVYDLIAAQVREEAQAALREAQAAVALQAETMGDAIATIDRLRQIAARDDGLCLVDCDTHIIAVPRAADGEASLACPQCRNDALLPALAEARAALAQVREDVARRIEAEAESAGRHGHHNARLNLLTAAYIAREGTQTEAPPRRSVPMTQDKGQATDSPDPDAPLRIETTEPDPRIASVALAVASSYEWARIAVEALDRYDADNSPASRDAKWIPVGIVSWRTNYDCSKLRSGHADAAFIADARTSLPRAVAALDAVLRLAAEYQASPHPSIVAFGREFTATITEHLDAP